MTTSLWAAIAALGSSEAPARAAAAREIYMAGRAPADAAMRTWWDDEELAELLFAPSPIVTVGVAVERERFARIRAANGMPQLAQVPPDQDAEEFELHK